MLTNAEHEAFRAFADLVDGMRERECTPYLMHATNYLLPQYPVEQSDIALERRSPYGRSDFIVVATLKDEHGPTNKYLYFWELKAPQCALMEMDDAATRFRPTKDLIKAETQLLHYVHQAKSDRDLQSRLDIRYPENIRMGGIIIGRDARICHDKEHQEAAEHSLRIRLQSLYDRSGMRILTWDRILEVTKPA